MASHKQLPTGADEQACSVPLQDADLSLGNANWSRGLQSMSDWIWSGHLNPEPFPNNLARFFLQIPAIFEQQLNFSTTLLFDEPSFRNGVQISGFVPRVCRELVINYIGQRRRAPYTMTHHCVLGRLTCMKHGLNEQEYENKLFHLLHYRSQQGYFEAHERVALDFAEAFCTDPKQYSDSQYDELRRELMRLNRNQYSQQGLWLRRLHSARAAWAKAIAKGEDEASADKAARKAADETNSTLTDTLNERLVHAQVIELTGVALQFIALADVLTALAVPDEDFLPEVTSQLVPRRVQDRIQELLNMKDADLPALVPPKISVLDDPQLIQAIANGEVRVEPSRPSPSPRVPMTPYEGKDDDGHFRPAFAGSPDQDKGLTIGGIQVGTYGWGFGGHFPGSLVYAFMHHPELSRFEAPYSLPVLFNEDEWRNGTQTGGYVSRRLKELVIQKIYKTSRSRYGIEHHTMFLYNSFKDQYGVGREPRPQLTENQKKKANDLALGKARAATLWIHIHEKAPKGTYSSLEAATISWTDAILNNPHRAQQLEPAVRDELDIENRRENEAGLRHLDTTPGLGRDVSFDRLVDHQIAELAMLIGHMDGLGRALTILRLEAESAVQTVEGNVQPSGKISPTLDTEGCVQLTGYFNNRPDLHDVLRFVGLDAAVLTINELMANPRLAEEVQQRHSNGEIDITYDAQQAAQTGEF